MWQEITSAVGKTTKTYLSLATKCATLLDDVVLRVGIYRTAA